MKTIEFEDALKDYLEEMKRTGWYTKAYEAFVEANILKLVMERRPIADSNDHDGSVRRDPNDRDRPGGRGDDRSLHEVRDRTDGSRVLSPPEANLLRPPLRSNDLAAPQIPDDTGATPAMGRELWAAEPARTWRSTTSCVGNGSTPSAYQLADENEQIAR
jgi:hypothetical protein